MVGASPETRIAPRQQAVLQLQRRWGDVGLARDDELPRRRSDHRSAGTVEAKPVLGKVPADRPAEYSGYARRPDVDRITIIEISIAAPLAAEESGARISEAVIN
ncbi:MAG: hypothetical protein ABI056_09160, partial [Caulobacteraceae bacterium]